MIKCYLRVDLKNFLEIQGMKSGDLAEVACISPSMAWKILNNTANPSIEAAYAISSALRIDFDSLWKIQDKKLKRQPSTKTVFDNVETILQEEPLSRNSDRYLLVRYSQRFGTGSLEADILDTEFPTPSSLTRFRRSLAAKYPPNDFSKINRKKLEKQYRTMFGK